MAHHTPGAGREDGFSSMKDCNLISPSRNEKFDIRRGLRLRRGGAGLQALSASESFCRLDSWKALEGRFLVEAASQSALLLQNLAALTRRKA